MRVAIATAILTTLFASVGQAQNRRVPTLDELMLFFPTRFPEGDWQPAGLDYQDVYFSSADGTKLHGWYCAAQQPRAYVLLSHGNAGHIADRAPWLKLLQRRLQVSVLALDYRGYGKSEGTPTVPGVLADATAARAQLRQLAGIEDSEIVLMGESLGGAISVQLAAASPPRALILQSTFASLRDVANVHFPRVAWMVPRGKLNSLEAIAHYQGPLLQSHGTDDRTIPIAQAEKLFATAKTPQKLFVKLRGADHNDWLTEHYIQQLDQFLKF